MVGGVEEVGEKRAILIFLVTYFWLFYENVFLLIDVELCDGEKIMKKPQQVSYYFITTLEDYECFIGLSDRHWTEEFEKYEKYISSDS